jgi:hypothetical protein
MFGGMTCFRSMTPWLSLLVGCGGAVASPGGTPPDADGGAVTHPLSCTTLSVDGPVQQVSDGTAMNLSLTSLAAGNDGALVGWSALLRDPPATFHVREIGFDAVPVKAGVEALAGQGTVAQGFGHAAAVSGTGPCDFVPLGSDGSTSGPSVQVASTACGLFRATSSGYALVAGAGQMTPPSLVLMDASGHAVSSSPLSTEGDALAWAALPDGSFVVVSASPVLDNCVCPTEFYVQHFSASGQPLAPQHRAGETWPGSSVGIAAMGTGGVLVASTPLPGAALGVQAFDADGNAQGSAVPLVTVDAGGPFSAKSVQLAALGDRVAIATWIETSGTTVAHVVAQTVSSAGEPLSAPISVAPASGQHLRVVATPTGAVVAWDQQSGAPVSAASLRCDD